MGLAVTKADDNHRRKKQMLNRRIFLLAMTASATTGLVIQASAASHESFTQEAFEAAQKAGKPILIEITASWCPTCRAQKKIMAELLTSPNLGKLAIFEVDFDSQKEVVRAFGATMQSTLITFKGTVERGRSVGDTKSDSIRQLLETTV